MRSALERRLGEFVDRGGEIELFKSVLDRDDTPILVVWGGGGVGKSSLLSRMIHECAQRGLKKSEVTWTETRNHDYLAVMRKMRDDVGPGDFQAFTDRVNYFTVPKYELKIQLEHQGSIRVAENAVIEGSEVGVIAGVHIEDVMLAEPRADMAVPEAQRMAELTDLFISGLAAATAAEPLVVFFDAVEKTTPSTRAWIWEELLGAVCDGRLGAHLRFVLCGREEPPADLDRDLSLMIEEAELAPLGHEHIVEYLERRGVEEGQREALATMIEATVGGVPLQVASAVDSFLKMRRRRG